MTRVGIIPPTCTLWPVLRDSQSRKKAHLHYRTDQPYGSVQFHSTDVPKPTNGLQRSQPTVGVRLAWREGFCPITPLVFVKMWILVCVEHALFRPFAKVRNPRWVSAQTVAGNPSVPIFFVCTNATTVVRSPFKGCVSGIGILPYLVLSSMMHLDQVKTKPAKLKIGTDPVADVVSLAHNVQVNVLDELACFDGCIGTLADIVDHCHDTCADHQE